MDWNEFLHEAVSAKDIISVRQVLAKGTNPNYAGDAWDNPLGGNTELYWAVSAGDLEIVRLLLVADAKVAAAARGWRREREERELAEEVVGGAYWCRSSRSLHRRDICFRAGCTRNTQIAGPSGFIRPAELVSSRATA